MYRSYFFALFACAVFSFAALVNAYHSLPQEKVMIAGEMAKMSEMAEREAAEREAAERETAEREMATRKIMALHRGHPDEQVPLDIEAAGEASPPAGYLSLASESIPSHTEPLNARTDNFNLLLLGTDDKKLEMVCVYSINHHLKSQLKSVSLFFPVNSVLLYKGKEKTLDSIYASGGWEAVAEAVGNRMFIDLDYYVKIDRQALRDLEKYFEPIYVDGEKVEMETLFVRRTSSKDDRIIARILKQVLRPQVFFRYIPGLVFGINGGLESNLSFTPRNLADYYRIGCRLSTKRIEKVVLLGGTAWQNGRRVNVPPEEIMSCAIYWATEQ